MKNKKFLAIAILAIVTVVCIALAACDFGGTHTCTSKCETCQKCTDKECKQSACKEKCPGHDSDPLGEYDMSGVTFTDKVVVYNGEEQTLEVEGTLPNGVTVAYEYAEGDTALEGAPVNAGTYTVVAKFTGDDNHEAIEDMTATLTIEKADIVVVLGARQSLQGGQAQDLPEQKIFEKHADGTFSLQYDGVSYVIDVLSSNLALEDLNSPEFFKVKAEDGTLSEPDQGHISSDVGSEIFVRVSLDEDGDNYEALSRNYNDTVVTSVTVTKIIFEISNAEELQRLRTDLEVVSEDLLAHTKYVLVDDIDLEGATWLTVAPKLFVGQLHFTSEFDGQGHTISGFVLNKDSILDEDVNHDNGIAIGFFGYLGDTATPAYIHDVVFADFSVDLDVRDFVETSTAKNKGWKYWYAYGGNANCLLFGVVAGQCGRGGANGSEDIVLENILVRDADIDLKWSKGFIGVFVGRDYAADTYRKNLDSENVTLRALEIVPEADWVQRDSSADLTQIRDNFIIGGISGDLGNTSNITFEDCDSKNLTIISGNEDMDIEYNSWIGGFVGRASGQTGFEFKNCTVTNLKVVNYTQSGSKLGEFCGNNAIGDGIKFTECKAENDDETFGLFNYVKSGEGQWELQTEA